MSDIKDYEPIWGAWHVDNLIGGGSFGKVYKVHKEEFGKTYEAAVKMISIPQSEEELRQAQNDGLDAESVRSYFQVSVTDIIQEIDLMNTFRGTSNIVSLEDHKVVEKQHEIVWDILIRMELLTTLSSYVTEHPLSEADVVKLGVHICRALELCAAHNAIHRDIKPENIFVSPHGDFKLGDFGIARQIERTMSGLSKKGTENYMAPEVFKGAEYGASVDIYSLGIVMYKFLNKNRRPFLPEFPNPITPRDRENALQRRMSGEPVPINFKAFYYAFLSIALAFASIDAARSKKFIFQVILCLEMLGYAGVVSWMIVRAMRGVISQTHYAYVAGAVGIPLVLVLASPAGIMFARDKWDMCAVSSFIALLGFALTAFILSALNPVNKILFYAANSNLIKFMPEVPLLAIILVLICQTIAFSVMLFLAVAQGLPVLYLKFKFKKFLMPFSITLIISAVGLFAALKLLAALV